jgi:hypothetical protein
MSSKRKSSAKDEPTGKKKKTFSRAAFSEEVKTQARANAPKIRYMCFAHCSSTTEAMVFGLTLSYGFQQIAVTSALHKRRENAKEEAKAKLADRIKQHYVSASSASEIGWSDSDTPDKKFDYIRAMINSGAINVKTMAWDFWEQQFINYKPKGECTTQVLVSVPKEENKAAPAVAPTPAATPPVVSERKAIMPPLPAAPPLPPPRAIMSPIRAKIKIEVVSEPRVKLESRPPEA